MEDESGQDVGGRGAELGSVREGAGKVEGKVD